MFFNPSLPLSHYLVTILPLLPEPVPKASIVNWSTLNKGFISPENRSKWVLLRFFTSWPPKCGWIIWLRLLGFRGLIILWISTTCWNMFENGGMLVYLCLWCYLFHTTVKSFMFHLTYWVFCYFLFTDFLSFSITHIQFFFPQFSNPIQPNNINSNLCVTQTLFICQSRPVFENSIIQVTMSDPGLRCLALKSEQTQTALIGKSISALCFLSFSLIVFFFVSLLLCVSDFYLMLHLKWETESKSQYLILLLGVFFKFWLSSLVSVISIMNTLKLLWSEGFLKSGSQVLCLLSPLWTNLDCSCPHKMWTSTSWLDFLCGIKGFLVSTLTSPSHTYMMVSRQWMLHAAK